jgi:Zn-finger nucleic acid-binding protein
MQLDGGENKKVLKSARASENRQQDKRQEEKHDDTLALYKQIVGLSDGSKRQSG